MENTKVPYRIKKDRGNVIVGVICCAYAYYGLINNITPSHRYGTEFYWLIFAFGIGGILTGGHSYMLTEKGIFCHVFGIPIKSFRWEQVSHVIFFPEAGNARIGLAATLLFVTRNCPVYKKDRQDTNSFWLYTLIHCRNVIKLRMPDKKDQEILPLVRELCKTPIETRERKPQ